VNEWIDPLATTIAMVASALCGFMAGREWRKKQFGEQLLKDEYERGKLDGAYEFIKDTLFSSLTKRQPKDGNSSGGNVQDAEK
jgi:hypothetical protein